MGGDAYLSPGEYVSQVTSIMTAFTDLVDKLKLEKEALVVERDEIQLSMEAMRSLNKECKVKESETERKNKDLQASLDQAMKAHRKCSDAAFAVALLDGDGLIFAEELMKVGAEGGRQAARDLLAMLRSCLATWAGDGVDKLPIIVNIYFNREGLRSALKQYANIGGIHYDNFIQGLSSAQHLLAVIDVGFGKDNADDKIKEAMRLYAGVPQCGAIIIGGSHDAGYIGALNNFVTVNMSDKLIVLKNGSFMAKGYADLGLPLFELPAGLFRREPLYNSSYRAKSDKTEAVTSSTSANAPQPGDMQSLTSAADEKAAEKLTSPKMVSLDLCNTTEGDGTALALPADNSAIAAPNASAFSPALPQHNVWKSISVLNALASPVAKGTTYDSNSIPAPGQAVKSDATSANHRTVPCKNHFYNNHCAFADKCTFSHNEGAKSKLYVKMWQALDSAKIQGTSMSGSTVKIRARPLLYAIQISQVMWSGEPLLGAVKYALNKQWTCLKYATFEDYVDEIEAAGLVVRFNGTNRPETRIAAADTVGAWLEK